MTLKWKARIQWAQCLNEQFGLHSHALVGFGSHLKSLGTNKLIFIVTRTHNSSFQEWLFQKKWSQALSVLLSLFSHYKIKASFLSKWPKISKKKSSSLCKALQACPYSSWLHGSSENTQLWVHLPQSNHIQAFPKAIALFIQ